ncbi:MAG: trypsin-like peptidase domain-containing protein, partial [Actinomycetota bacterium]|nr:trypsin-like peptidase domain-containing protein [Actinomycetota bacterium]
ALAAIALGAGWVGGTWSSDGATSSSDGSPAAENTSFAGETTLDVGGIVETVEPSVVAVTTRLQQQRGPFVTEGEGEGSGVIIDDQGHVLTNAHVVEGATEIAVIVEGDERSASLVAADAGTDIAVLRLDDTSGLTPATIAEGDIAVGDDVVAIGNALGLEGSPTVTRGIVSALDRSIETATGTLSGLIQTDAAISSGNSGGPLVDASGQVIGINTAVAASGVNVQASNIGFAIPIEDALDIAEQLLSSAS